MSFLLRKQACGPRINNIWIEHVTITCCGREAVNIITSCLPRTCV